MPRKAPTKTRNNEISQTFNDGILKIYSIVDEAPPGYQPRAKLTEKARLKFESRIVGMSRYYAAYQNQIRIEKVLRVPVSNVTITTQDCVMIITERGETEPNHTVYRVDFIQEINDVNPKCLDLTLVRYKQEIAR